MQQIKTEINIAAPPSEVWNMIKNIDAWHEWSPIINASQGKAVIGETLSITMTGKESGQDGAKYSPVIIAITEDQYLHWRAHMLAGFVFTNDKILTLEETETGTRLIHIETFKGLMAPLMSGSVQKNLPPMLESMNNALKQLVE
ncbi:SRPBCC domain-containing protein [Paraglaciecola sp.]